MRQSLTNNFSIESPEPLITDKPQSKIKSSQRSSKQLNFENRASSECITAKNASGSTINKFFPSSMKKDYEADQKVAKNIVHREQMLAGQDHTIQGLNLEKNRLHAFKKNTNHFQQLRKSHNYAMKQQDPRVNGAALMPIQSQLNITNQTSVLNSSPTMVQAKDDINAYNFYRKPIMKEKSQIQNHLMSNSQAYNQRER